MENIFSTNIVINNQSAAYHIVFENEKYSFRPEGNNTDLPAFDFSRENNEWTEQQAIDPEIKKQAINALEKYLLSQH